MIGDTVGIDLGTTYSSIAYIDDDGKPTISYDSDDNANTPSFIIIEDDGNTLVGSVAKESCVLYDKENIVNGIKRQIGTDYKVTIGGRSYNPSQLSAIILDKLLGDFEEKNGFRPDKAVITCPAYFGNDERRATKQAGEIAGLKEITLLNEPTSAAVCFGFGQDEECRKRILVYDLGGGTFDVTILEIDGREFTAVATDGERRLGGKDWDAALTEIILEKISEASGISTDRLKNVPELMQQLVIDSEVAKKKLTSFDSISMTILHKAHKYRYTVTREEFEMCTESLIQSTIDIMDRALSSKNFSPTDIDEIVLVGGSTLMPQVTSTIRANYPDNKVSIYDPHESIAKGAAIYALSLETSHRRQVVSTPEPAPVEEEDYVEDVAPATGLSDSGEERVLTPCHLDEELPETEIEADIPRLVIHNVLSKTFGVEVQHHGEPIISNIIFRNETLPIQVTKTYNLEDDYQEEILVSIYEDSAFNNPDGVKSPLIEGNLVGSFKMLLPPEVDSNTKVDVIFTATAEGILTATAECMGQRKDYRIDSDIIMSAEDIESSKETI